GRRRRPSFGRAAANPARSGALLDPEALRSKRMRPSRDIVLPPSASVSHHADVAAVPQHPPLASILAAAPIALGISDRDGNTIFSTFVGPHQDRRRFEVEVDGNTYSLSLAIDDSEQQQREEELIRRAYFDELTGL